MKLGVCKLVLLALNVAHDQCLVGMKVGEEREHVGGVLDRLLPRHVVIVVELAERHAVVEKLLAQVELGEGGPSPNLYHHGPKHFHLSHREVLYAVEGPAELGSLFLHQAVLKVGADEPHVPVESGALLRALHLINIRWIVHLPPPPGIRLVLFRCKHRLSPKVPKETHQALAIQQGVQDAKLPLEPRVHLRLGYEQAPVLGHLHHDPLSRHLGFAGEGDESAQGGVFEIGLCLLPFYRDFGDVGGLAVLELSVWDLDGTPPLGQRLALHPLVLVAFDILVVNWHVHPASHLFGAPGPGFVLFPPLLNVPEHEDGARRQESVQHGEREGAAEAPR
mmetsp:Transcript_10480/g.27223  ORF Transcript_10480/g.27223 Transcript_10480/m.27223 type:complete len:335 (-) Transcript_10480:606-1610(-)